MAGSILVGSIVLVVEIFANRPIANTIGHAQFDLRAAQSAALKISSTSGSFAGANADGLNLERLDEGRLIAVGPDEVSDGVNEVSVYADEDTWAAAVSARPGACFYLKITTTERRARCTAWAPPAPGERRSRPPTPAGSQTSGGGGGVGVPSTCGSVGCEPVSEPGGAGGSGPVHGSSVVGAGGAITPAASVPFAMTTVEAQRSPSRCRGVGPEHDEAADQVGDHVGEAVDQAGNVRPSDWPNPILPPVSLRTLMPTMNLPGVALASHSNSTT